EQDSDVLRVRDSQLLREPAAEARARSLQEDSCIKAANGAVADRDVGSVVSVDAQGGGRVSSSAVVDGVAVEVEVHVVRIDRYGVAAREHGGQVAGETVAARLVDGVRQVVDHRASA